MKVCIIIFSLLSLFTFFLFGIDKWKAVRHKWRISEATLLFFSFFGGIGGFAAMLLFRHKTRKWKFRILVPLFAVLDAAVIVFLLWTADYYQAGEKALSAMQSDQLVSVDATATGWLFDGPSENEALIFYPGAKVDEKAYAPLLRELAEGQMDVYLVKMPLHLAIFGMNAAGSVVREGGYDRYYIGGHSLGGAMAASYAAAHEEQINGVILLASYPTKATNLDTILIYGSEDGVLNMDRVENAEKLVSGAYEAYCMEGGNHAQFGDYGYQAGDGEATISAKEQWDLTCDEIIRFIG